MDIDLSKADQGRGLSIDLGESIAKVVPVEEPQIDTDATAWLELELLQLVLSEMNLPLETSFDDLFQLDLPQINTSDHAPFAVDEAEDRCGDCWLFNSVRMVTRLAPKPIQQLGDVILALIWQDAVELAIASDLACSCDDDRDYWLRSDIAQEKWDSWQELDGLLVAAIEDFFDRYIKNA